MITHLERVVPAAPGPSPGADDSHPMRAVTRQAAFDPEGWTPERAAQVTAVFDGLAPEWHARGGGGRIDPVADALARGGPLGEGTWLEIGSGVGLLSPFLAARCAALVAVDLSSEMLRRAPADVGHRVQADGARLPVASRSVDAVVLVNALLFPPEAERVLADDGAVVWVSSHGSATPIYLPADDVAAAMGPGWAGVASEAGNGSWAVLRRTR